MITIRTFCVSLLILAVCCTPAFAQEKKLRDPDVHYEPSSMAVVEEMLRLANVQKGDVIYDLGSGDGRIVIEAARRYGARGVGIDIDPERIEESRENAVKSGVADLVVFRNEDMFEADIKDATVVTLFLWGSVNLKLRPKLLKELKPGTRLVSHYWDMGDWKPEKQIEVDGHQIYFWVIPERK
ncbi:MAG TPA: class I SAM-dependent methyltransferase [Acidobacteriota bacterium]|nr:class I SAM-dependent methyltransferase [Acidobacteriota bacterium]